MIKEGMTSQKSSFMFWIGLILSIIGITLIFAFYLDPQLFGGLRTIGVFLFFIGAIMLFINFKYLNKNKRMKYRTLIKGKNLKKIIQKGSFKFVVGIAFLLIVFMIIFLFEGILSVGEYIIFIIFSIIYLTQWILFIIFKKWFAVGAYFTIETYKSKEDIKKAITITTIGYLVLSLILFFILKLF